MVRRIFIGDNERAVVFRKRRFREILGPGEHWVWGLGIELEFHKTKEVVFNSDWADYLVNQRADVVSRWFVAVETNDSQVAVVYFDGKVNRVVGPGKRVLFWRGAVAVTSELIDARADIEVPARLLPVLSRLAGGTCMTFAMIEEGRRGLLYVDGRLVREIPAGTYGFWSAVAVPRIEVLDTRLQTLEVTGQEILTSDKVTVRVNVWAAYEVVDASRSRTSVKDAADHLYRSLQLAVRKTLGKRTLEEALAEKADIDQSVSVEVRREMEQFGVRVGEIALKDIILPGDIREILNQVVAAEKQAQANLIRRREETAATRSLLNTARLMENNPLLVRMKELETLEKVAEKVDKITVVGGLDGLLERTVTIRAE